MLRAEQQALVQEANQQLIAIRSAELGYLYSYFSSFGTQCVLIVGFVLSSITQVPAIDSGQKIRIVNIYWVSSTLVFCVSLHCMLTTIYVTVYGTGFALRGPLGSMVKAVDGMLEERGHILLSYVLTIIFFTISTVATFFIVMTDQVAVVCMGLVFISSFVWYHYCLRIYNRFKVTYSKSTNWDSKWNERSEAPTLDNPMGAETNQEDLFSALSPHYRDDDGIQHQLPKRNGLRESLLSSQEHYSDTNRKSGKVGKKKLGSTFKSLFSWGGSSRKGRKNSKEAHADGAGENHVGFNVEGADGGTFHIGRDLSFYEQRGGTNKIGMEGYLSARLIADEALDRSSATNVLSPKGSKIYSLQGSVVNSNGASVAGSNSGKWKRSYFVLLGNDLYYYASKREFEERPQEPTCTRPIDLLGFSITGVSLEAPYRICLVPIDPENDRLPWEFRCDTLFEMENWSRALTQAAESKTAETMKIRALTKKLQEKAAF